VGHAWAMLPGRLAKKDARPSTAGVKTAVVVLIPCCFRNVRQRRAAVCPVGRAPEISAALVKLGTSDRGYLRQTGRERHGHSPRGLGVKTLQLAACRAGIP